jgi:hypothetical protein
MCGYVPFCEVVRCRIEGSNLVRAILSKPYSAASVYPHSVRSRGGGGYGPFSKGEFLDRTYSLNLNAFGVGSSC